MSLQSPGETLTQRWTYVHGDFGLIDRNEYRVIPPQAALAQARFVLRLLKWIAAVGVALLAADAAWLGANWPDWTRIASGPVPASRFILRYAEQAGADPSLPPLRWTPVPLRQIPAYVQRAVLIAEDDRFYEHGGFDLVQIRDALEDSLSSGRLVRGASSISQQTAKNLFLSPSRSLLRKWHEAVYTVALENRLSKDRILEIYLNIAELGQGVYGVEAASRYYFDRGAARLSLRQAAELAASLPSPVQSNPETRSDFFMRHAARIEQRLRGEFPDGVHAAPLEDALDTLRRLFRGSGR